MILIFHEIQKALNMGGGEGSTLVIYSIEQKGFTEIPIQRILLYAHPIFERCIVMLALHEV